MPLLGREPLVLTTIDFLPGGRVAVTISPARDRWPGHEASDRLVIPLGIAALALQRAPEATIGAVHGRLRSAATGIARADPPAEAGAFFTAISGFQGATGSTGGDPSVAVRLLRSSLGPIPSIGRARHGSVLLANAAVAALGTCASGAGPAVRLSSALAIEGLLGWYREADPHLQPPQQAVAYCLRHAVARLDERKREPPEALLTAVHEHRKISPMAGGA